MSLLETDIIKSFKSGVVTKTDTLLSYVMFVMTVLLLLKELTEI